MDRAGIGDAGAASFGHDLIFDARQAVDFDAHAVACAGKRRIGRLADQNDVAGSERQKFVDVRDQAIDRADQIGERARQRSSPLMKMRISAGA